MSEPPRTRAALSVALNLTWHGLSLAARFALGVLIARRTGAANYGIYGVIMGLCTLLAIPAGAGQAALLTREMSARRRATRYTGTVFSSALGLVLAASAVVVAGAALVVYLTRHGTAYAQAGTQALWLIPLVALTATLTAVNRGRGSKRAASVPSMVVVPSAALVLVALFVPEGEDASAVLRQSVLASGVGLLAAMVLYVRMGAEPLIRPARHVTRSLARGGSVFLALAIATTLGRHVDIFTMAALAPADAVGHYTCAARLAILPTVGLIAINAVLAPDVAPLHRRGETQALQRRLRQAAGGNVAFALAVAAGLWLFHRPLLGLFGEEFTAAAPALAVLTCGYVFASLAGSCAQVLLLTGHQGYVVRVLLLATVFNAALIWLLVPTWGAVGASIATASAIVMWRTTLTLRCMRALGVDPSALSLLTTRGQA